MSTQFHEYNVSHSVEKEDLSPYFPCTEDPQLFAFVARDKKFDDRLNSLINLCATALHAEIAPQQYTLALRRVLFHNDYILTHKWATTEKYFYLNTIILSLMNYILLSSFSDGRSKNNPRTPVPQAFVDVLRICLSRMCDLPGVDANVVNAAFWKKWPQVFRSVVNYDTRKKNNKVKHL